MAHRFISKTDALTAPIGSVVFWLPSTILHVLRGSDFSFLHWKLLACVQAVLTVTTVVAIWLSRREVAALRRIALWTLLGIWALGPLWLSVNATFTGGGFAKAGGWLGVIVALVFFPVTTPLLSVYDGSIFNLLITTLLLALACLDFRAIGRRKVNVSRFL